MLGTLHVLAREPEPGRTPREPSRDPPEEIGVSRSPYHAGELAVQRRAGVAASAARIGRGIHDAIPPIARDFLAAQRMLIVGARDREGLVWASPLTGEPGFVRSVDERTVAVDARLEDGDPLAGALAPGAQVGLLAIDLANRRRMRLNGRLAAVEGRFVIDLDQVYANCPKYIHPRELEPLPSRSGDAPLRPPRRGDTLADDQQIAIARADTFFLATAHREAGADASHRGGPPGFVRVIDARALHWPDYAGNTMFNSLGNIAADPRAGILFVDFASGSTLQLSGRATVEWGEDVVASFPDAERVVRLDVDRVIDLEHARGLRSLP